MSSAFVVLILAALVIIISGASWRRRGARQPSPRVRAALIVGLVIVGVVLLVAALAMRR